MKKIIVIFIVSSLIFVSLSAENSLKKKFTQYAEDNAKGFLQPLVTSFGANMNTGYYNSAKVLGPLKFGVSFQGLMCFVPDDDKTFTMVSPTVEYDGQEYYLYTDEDGSHTIEAPTVFGGDGSDFTINPQLANLDDFDNLEDKDLPNGADISAIPYFTPQINLGLPGGNELMLRYLPVMEISEDTGDIGYFGVGLKHSIDQYLTALFPVDIAVQGVYQKATITDNLDIENIAFNAHASKKLLMWTLYGGLGWENTKMSADYKTLIYNPLEGDYTSQSIDFDLESDNDYRMTLGIKYTFLIANFWADYSLCKYPVLNFGFGLSL